MAAKFVELNEAAEMLGVSPDRLNEMRLRGEIHGLRDGTSWKFKVDEVQRVADELGAPAQGAEDEALDFQTAHGGGSDLHLDVEGDDADSPTAIGSMEDFEDLGVAIGSDLDLGGDDTIPARPSDTSSDVALIPGDDGSSVNLVADSGADILAGSDLGFGPSGSDELGFEGSDLSVASGTDVTSKKRPVGGSSPELNITDDAELSLDDDDELVLEGSGDVTSGTGDTGINLTSPSDSGLNLEDEPLDLAGSSVSSLELPEDDDIIDLDDLDAGPEDARRLRADEDFQLAPSSLSADDDDEDSGSQVIALEDSEAFDGAATMLVEEGEAEPVLGQSQDELEGALDQYGASAARQPGLGVGYAPAAELPYSIWNVLGLLVVLMVLALTGMLMADLVRNMWSWNETYTASTSIMDFMVSMFGLQP